MSQTTTTPVAIKSDQLHEQFRALKGTRMMTITVNSEPRLRAPKSNPLNGRVRKVQNINGAVGYNYTAAVNRERVKDDSTPDFQAMARRDMAHLGGALLQHTQTKEYYTFLRPKHRSDAIYYVDGKITPIADIKDLLYFPPKRVDGGRQDVSKEVPYINIKLTNISGVKGF